MGSPPPKRGYIPNEDALIYTKRNYEIYVCLWPSGNGGCVYFKRDSLKDSDKIWYFDHPVKRFWHTSLQKACMIAIDFVNRRVAKELENEVNLEVMKEIVSELPELLS